MPESVQTTSDIESPEDFAAYLESQEVPMTLEEQAWMQKFQRDLDQSRMMGECDCKMRVVKAQFQGSLNSDAFVQIFNPGSPVCGPMCPLFWTYATTNGCSSNPAFLDPNCVNDAIFQPISGNVSPNVQDFNCSIDKGSSTTVRTNVGLLGGSNGCTESGGVPTAGIYVTIEVDCNDNSVPFSPLQTTSYSYVIGANQTFAISHMVVDENCKPAFPSFGM